MIGFHHWIPENDLKSVVVEEILCYHRFLVLRIKAAKTKRKKMISLLNSQSPTKEKMESNHLQHHQVQIRANPQHCELGNQKQYKN